MGASTKGYTEIYLISYVLYSISISKFYMMYENNIKSVKISLKLFTQNMDKELCIKILEERLPKWENVVMKIGSCSLIMIQNKLQNGFRIFKRKK